MLQIQASGYAHLAYKAHKNQAPLDFGLLLDAGATERRQRHGVGLDLGARFASTGAGTGGFGVGGENAIGFVESFF